MKILPIPNDNITKVCELLNQLIGDVTSKNLFTGYGLFHKQKDMFAVWVNNKVYLRAKDELSIKLKGLGCKSFTTNELNKRFVLSDYYALTESILKDNVLMRTLIILSITQIRKEKLDLALSKIGRIRDLPNLSIKYERALNKVGVDNVDTLRKIGAENAIVRLKKADISASEAFIGDFVELWKIVIVSFTLKKRRKEGLVNLMKYSPQMDLDVVNEHPKRLVREYYANDFMPKK